MSISFENKTVRGVMTSEGGDLTLYAGFLSCVTLAPGLDTDDGASDWLETRTMTNPLHDTSYLESNVMAGDQEVPLVSVAMEYFSWLMVPDTMNARAGRPSTAPHSNPRLLPTPHR